MQRDTQKTTPSPYLELSQSIKSIMDSEQSPMYTLTHFKKLNIKIVWLLDPLFWYYQMFCYFSHSIRQHLYEVWSTGTLILVLPWHFGLSLQVTYSRNFFLQYILSLLPLSLTYNLWKNTGEKTDILRCKTNSEFRFKGNFSNLYFTINGT